ncbi:MAG: ABC transporter substrate-binding protein [Anaerolineae bacterium]
MIDEKYGRENINQVFKFILANLFILGFILSCSTESDLYVNRFKGDKTTPAVSDFDVTLNQPDRFPAGTELRILQWNHFVPLYDEWFDQFAAEWGEQNGVQVTVDRFDFDEIENALEQELLRGEGHTMVELLFPPSAWIEDLHDLTDLNEQAIRLLGEQKDTCQASSYLPTIDSYYAFCHGYAPDPGNFLIDEWTAIGYPNGPSQWEHLLSGGREIINQTGKPVGLGISPEIDSEMVIRSVIWSYGGSVQDQNENVTLNSPETVEAVKFFAELFEQSMDSMVLDWKPSSNNNGLINGELSFIVNSLSAYRAMQKVNPERAKNTGFTKPLGGPAGEFATAHVWMIYVVPLYVEEVELSAAKAFMLHLAANYGQAVYNSELYNFPAWSSTTPQLYANDGWLMNDPFESGESDRLAVLASSDDWYVNLGYPGVANPAISQVFDEKVISKMVIRVVNDEMTAEESVAMADQRVREIFDIWRGKGLVGGSE